MIGPVSLRILAGVLLESLLPGCHAEEEFYDIHQCWSEDFVAYKYWCCGPPVREVCFDEVHSVERCCLPSEVDTLTFHGADPAGEPSCLPMSLQHVLGAMSLSTRLDDGRASTARPVACVDMEWRMAYAVLRVGPIDKLPRAMTASLRAVTNATDLSEYGKVMLDLPLRFASPLRSMLVCVPRQCSPEGQDAAKLAVAIAEQTLPTVFRPSSLRSPEVLSLETLVGVRQRIGAGSCWPACSAASARRALRGVACRSGGCAALQLGGQALRPRNGTSLPGTGAMRPGAATIVVDVGTWQRSEFLDQLEASGEEGRLWVIAFEPDPRSASAHPRHPRLALIEAAVGVSEGGRADLHLTEWPACNSLLPLSKDAKRLHYDAGPKTTTLLGHCLTPAEQGSLSVRVVPLAAVLRLLPRGQEVAFLKIDAQGSDLAVVLSAGSELGRVRRIQLEVLAPYSAGDPRMIYDGAASKLDVIRELAARGFILEACRQANPDIGEEDCLFVRADLISEEARLNTERDLVYGEVRWDRPEEPGHWHETGLRPLTRSREA